MCSHCDGNEYREVIAENVRASQWAERETLAALSGEMARTREELLAGGVLELSAECANDDGRCEECDGGDCQCPCHAMKVLCAWHMKNFGTELVMRAGTEPASHGICEDCSALERAS